MEESVFERIRGSYSQLSDARAKVAQFLIEHWEEAAFMSAAKVGAAAGVSDTAVIRFAESIGYSGYAELQRSIQDAVRTRLNSFLLKRLDSVPRATDPDFLNGICDRMFESIRCTFQKTTPNEIADAAKMILDANHIYVIGLRGGHAPAHFLCHNLVLMLGNTRGVITLADSMFDELRLITRGDLLIAVTFKKHNLLTFRAAKMAKNWGARIMVITDDALSPAAQISDKALLVESTSYSFGHSHMGTLALMNAILETVVLLDKNRVRKGLAEADEISRDFHPVRALEEEMRRKEI